MSDGFSLSDLEREKSELQKDFVAFSKAYDLIRHRIMESTEVQPPRHPMLHEWSGSRAVCGSLEMSIHAVERTVLEMDELIRKIKLGEIPNTDPPERPERPQFGVLDGGRVT